MRSVYAVYIFKAGQPVSTTRFTVRLKRFNRLVESFLHNISDGDMIMIKEELIRKDEYVILCGIDAAAE